MKFFHMANTYTQIHLQLVFAVPNRNSLIKNQWKDELFQYITGTIQNHGHKLIIINSMPDHIHLLIGMRPIESLSHLVQHIKQDSSKWINSNRLVDSKFKWQEGYGGFSYAKSQIPAVINYIKNQEIQHKRKSFIEEYKEFLEKFELAFDERYIFKRVL